MEPAPKIITNLPTDAMLRAIGAVAIRHDQLEYHSFSSRPLLFHIKPILPKARNHGAG
jgi:hypothetical protein